MRTRVLAAVLTSATLLALTGCVQFHSDLTIDGKGGGTAKMSMSVGTEVLAALGELKTMGGNELGLEVPDLDGMTRASLDRRAAGKGVTVASFEKVTTAGRQTMTCELGFAHLKGLSLFLNDIASALAGTGLGIDAVDGGNLALRSRQYAVPARPQDKTPAAAQPTAEQGARRMELAGVVMSALGETDLVLKFTVPGDVVRSNATVVEGRTAIWKIDASNLMNQQSDVAPEIVFAGAGLSLKPPKE